MPRGWAVCNGSILAISQNNALFSLLGTTYGGNGSTTFGIPDYRGRSISGFGGTHSMGEKAGSEKASILTSQMPSHTHIVPPISLGADNSDASVSDPRGSFPANVRGGNMYGNAAKPGSFLGAPSTTVAIAGGSVPFNALSPYLPLTCCIALVGIYPSRS